MKSVTKHTTGAALMAALWNAARAKGHSQKQLAEALGVSFPYLSGLLTGVKPVPQMSHEKLRVAAQYLDVPVAQVFLMAEILKRDDFIVRADLERELGRRVETMRADPMWCALAPSETTWKRMPVEARISMCALYDRVSAKQLDALTQREVPSCAMAA